MKKIPLSIRTLAAAALVGTAAGCASASGSPDCGPDWYAVGQRDGLMGAAPQEHSYSARCPVPVDPARYREGWKDGYARRPVPTS
jgi:hypothetical protein